MESAQVLALVMTLCIGTAYSLSCYTCTNEGSNSNCMTAVNCTAGTDSYCKTSVLSVKSRSYSKTSITKECASACTALNVDLSLASTSVSCCNTNLCNTSGASSVKSSSGILALSVGLFLALLGKSSL
ncbi:lymphocyte antigen 6E-like isoform X2 [Bombina bombina]|uniref:lymphocyte antigen 6E-like isoform X2 n=1 Tax=Bombina bombina TaxID=8345 RepID=UPI00235ACDEB|nr:lymphocyte antigen 6E-like isoform X2 [Bombina bombina]